MAKVSDFDLDWALDHPLRRQILLRMREVRTISNRDLAEDLEQPVGNVAYHVKVLLEAGAVRVARVKPARGVIKRFYSLKPAWGRAVIDLEESCPGSAAPGK